MQRIFVNIASLLDSELIPTIASALSKSDKPSALHFSVVHQHVENMEIEITKLVKEYGASLDYMFLPIEEVRGVGYARAIANEKLTDSFDYYLQIDSHTMFRDGWDSSLMDSYHKDKQENTISFIYSVYPKFYGYVDDQHWPDDYHLHNPNVYIEDNSLVLVDYRPVQSGSLHVTYMNSDLPSLYEFSEKPWSDNFNDRITDYFTANFVFGESKYFINTKYDPMFCYSGEEITMSARFFAKGVRIVAPLITPVWTDYNGHKEYRRVNMFVDQQEFYKNEKNKINWEEFQRIGIERLGRFIRGMIKDEFGITYEQWQEFVKTCTRGDK